MKFLSYRWRTAVTLLCLVHSAVVAPTMAAERPLHPSAIQGPWAAEPAAFDAESTSRVSAAMAQIPLRFEPNVGQTDAEVAFVVRGASYGAFLTHEELVLSLPRATHAAEAGKSRFDPDAVPSRRRDPETAVLPPAVVRMRLIGADMSRPVGEHPLYTKTNYFIGDDPTGWRADVPNFARVRYTSVYPGVDLVFYGDGGGLEYDLVVAPGASAGAVAMEWEGADTVGIDDAGALVLTVNGGELRMTAPVVYQEAEEGRTPVAGAFEKLGAERVGVRLGAYDPARPLVIDPVLVYSTFLGGSQGDTLKDLAVDASGSVYVTGWTFSMNFPTRLPFDSTHNGSVDVIVSKLSPSGNALVFSTYLGGSDGDNAFGLALDSDGNVYVSGRTQSLNFPTAYAYDTTFNGGSDDAFVTKLTRLGNGLIYSTFLGGSASDYSRDIAVDSNGNAYVIGDTDSTNFPTVNPYRATLEGIGDAFVTKLRISTISFGVQVDYSTYLGGSSLELSDSIAVDASGVAYVAGSTNSTDFPMWRAFDASFNGQFDGFVSKLKPDGSALLFSTYLGGTQEDVLYAIAIGRGAIYVTGATFSSDFPTTLGSYDRSWNGDLDALVTKLSPGPVFGPAYSLDYSTYLGGSGWEAGVAIAVTSNGTAYVTGQTTSTDFPTAFAYDSTFNGQYDVFVTKVSADGSSLTYSTYLGASNDDIVRTIAVDSVGAAYVAGQTSSALFPTPGGYDSTYEGASEGFIAKLQ